MGTPGRPSTQLDSGLGLRPHEFESRILRQLTRGNALQISSPGELPMLWSQFWPVDIYIAAADEALNRRL
jgi:hypothetical protein